MAQDLVKVHLPHDAGITKATEQKDSATELPIQASRFLPTVTLQPQTQAAEQQEVPALSILPEQPEQLVIPANFPSAPAQIAQDPLAPVLRQDAEPPSVAPLPDLEAPVPLPPPGELLQPSPSAPIIPPGTPSEDVPDTITVERFEVLGSTVFNAADFEAVTVPFTGRPLTFTELFQVRNAITQLYVDQGYVTSGAYIPPQTLNDGVVQIQVVEGQLEEINITGNQRLRPGYVRSRLELAADEPLNVDSLLEGLQLLQLDPLIDTISAELAAGVRPGTSALNVEISEADAFSGQIALDNGRSPSVGSFRRQASLTHANLLGFGDSLSIGYTNTDGSNGGDISYAIPINPRNGTLSFSAGFSDSEIIEEPFDALDIESESRYYELTYRQPIVQTPSEEFALSLTASRQESQSEFLGDFGDPLPFPSIGADDEGRTRISAVRFAQDWTRRGERQVFAARSQFSLGLDALNSTVSNEGPDSRFFAWRGQGQWVRLLAEDTLFVLRSDLQLTGDELVPQEQFGIGGQRTVRGYRQDQLLTDNGFLASAEVRLPILRAPNIDSILHIVPFVDFGIGWNNGDRPDPDPRSLLSAGLGLQWQMGDRFSARVDWGIPLINVSSEGDSLQENGLHFSLILNPF
ncbi:ShlB/FhaC/HecB family hemolysin secretion/activation protein [Oculatella sp. LEGE 06141]|nr:ShlB/FhaC/HecB family hemolysin secretion/activation protein [Oculatella sp. LEGE 06141]